jgi:hypothetical protein
MCRVGRIDRRLADVRALAWLVKNFDIALMYSSTLPFP